jgi:hypothetical protein
METRFLTVVGLKVTVGVSAAASFGGVMDLSTMLLVVGVFMKDSFGKLGAWCGAALLWRPGGLLPRARASA